jgi:Family of unknown function (DUF6518)
LFVAHSDAGRSVADASEDLLRGIVAGPHARLTRIVFGSTDQPSKLSRTFFLVTALGFAIGVLTVVGQGGLPGNWTTLANSGAVWLAAAFLVGSFMPTDRRAAAAGVVALIGAVVGYYASVPFIVEGAAADARSVAIWVVVALVGGPVFGIAGRWWHSDRSTRRIAASALLGVIFFAEGLDRILRNPHLGAVGWTMMAVGVAVPLILGRTNKERLWGLAAELPMVLAALGVYWLINSAFLWS